jgi:hypothetical protein
MHWNFGMLLNERLTMFEQLSVGAETVPVIGS